jgi:hypothetical protein
MNNSHLRQDDFRQNMNHGVFWITPCIAQGAYPEPATIQHLLAHNVTHIFNVGTAPLGKDVSSPPFREVIWRPFEDLIRIPDEVAIDCVGVLFQSLSADDSKVYIHCVAGQNRSPTILWLFLIACGLSPDDAKSAIEDRTLDAVAGHSKLIDDALVKTIQEHGKRNFQPLKRTCIIDPIQMQR